MILSPDDPVVRRWAAERERRRLRKAALRAALRAAAARRREAVKPAFGVYASAARRPAAYWREVIRQSAARRRLNKQLLTLAG